MSDQPPCPGDGLCCNRPLFDRTIFPCTTERRLKAMASRVRDLESEVIWMVGQIAELHAERDAAHAAGKGEGDAHA